MWRAFFYAVGYMMIFLGVQSLAFERIQLAPGKDAKQVIKRLLGEGAPTTVQSTSDPVERLAQSRPSGGHGSSFGPSRFPNGGFGGSTFSSAPYRSAAQGGLGVSSGRSSGVPRVDLAGYRSVAPKQSTALKAGTGRVIDAKDWMPWSLLAIGAVIVLYTRSFAVHS